MYTFGIGLIVGLAAGTLSGYAFAPQSGKQTQLDIKDESKKIQSRAMNKAAKFLTKGSQYVDQVDREYLEEKKPAKEGVISSDQITKPATQTVMQGNSSPTNLTPNHMASKPTKHFDQERITDPRN